MTPRSHIGAVILAAGLGRRMGGPKWRCEIAGRSFLDHVVQALHGAGVTEIVAVVGGEFIEEVQRQFPGVVVVANDRPDDGMLSSVRLGLAHVHSPAGALIAPVDHPLVRSSTIAGLATRFLAEVDAVVKPAFAGQSGHPILVPRLLFWTILRADQQESLSEVIRASGIRQVRFPCEDPEILHNINTPDYTAPSTNPVQ